MKSSRPLVLIVGLLIVAFVIGVTRLGQVRNWLTRGDGIAWDRKVELVRDDPETGTLKGIVYEIGDVILNLDKTLFYQEVYDVLYNLQWTFNNKYELALDDEILHVDIDDGSINTVGRWPWDRGTMAKAVHELAELKAKTVALDLIFTEPSRPRAIKEENNFSQDWKILDDDALLAEAMARVDTVLPINPEAESSFRSLDKCPALYDELATDISKDWDSFIDSLTLERVNNLLTESNVQERFSQDKISRLQRDLRGREMAVKERALERKLGMVSPEVLSTMDLTSLEKMTSAAVPETGGYYKERAVLERVLEEFKAWQHLTDNMLYQTEETANVSAGSSIEGFRFGDPPVESLAKVAAAIGTVENVTDSNFNTRSQPPLSEILNGQVFQFGLAAAFKHLDIDPKTIKFEPGRMVVERGEEEGENPSWLLYRVAQSNGKVRNHVPIYWPRTTDGWEGAGRQSDVDERSRGRMAIQRLIDMYDLRQKHAEYLETLEGQSRTLVFALMEDIDVDVDVLSEEIQRELLSQITFDFPSLLRIETASAAAVDENVTDSDLNAEDVARNAWGEFGNAYANFLREGMSDSITDNEIDKLQNKVSLAAKKVIEIESDSFGSQTDPSDSDVHDALLYQLFTDRADFISLKVPTAEQLGITDNEEVARLDNFANWIKARWDASQAGQNIAKEEDRMRPLVEGKLVFVSATASGLSDFVSTPLDIYGQTPGGLIHSSIANMVINAWQQKDDSLSMSLTWVEKTPLQWALSLCMGLIGCFAAWKLSPIQSGVLIAGVGAAYLGIFWYGIFEQFIFTFSETRNKIVDASAPLAAMGLTWIGSTAVQAVLDRKEKQMLKDRYSSRVSPKLMEFIVENPDLDLAAGRKQYCSFLFLDLAGFTNLSETLGPQRMVALLNAIMKGMAEPVLERDGYVDKFMGDAMMAFWSAFEPQSDQRERAIRCALDCQRNLAAIRDTYGEDANGVSVRVGVATGEASIGDCGAPPQIEAYTAIGDTVNLAARLESANKQFGTQCLCDGETVDGLPEDLKKYVRNLGEIVVVGQTVPIRLHEIRDYSVESSEVQEQASMEDQAISFYSDGDTDSSKNVWIEIESKFGSSKLSDLYKWAIEDGQSGAITMAKK